jgi:hypothetical protein
MDDGESVLSNAKQNSTAGLGLQKNIKQVVSQPGASAASEAGVSEQVARKANAAS